VLDCYTDDVRYHDPNTRGDVTGRDALRRYLTKLFAGWQMTWAAREVFDLASEEGVVFLWRATFRRPGDDKVVEIDGMDLAVLRGDRVARNEVYFDRTALMAGSPSVPAAR
jgi:ketosteroid isomerase-like protein